MISGTEVDTRAAKPFIECVRELRESRQMMSSQSLHNVPTATSSSGTRVAEANDKHPRSRVASWELPCVVKKEEKVKKDVPSSHRNRVLHEHLNDTTEKMNAKDRNYATDADRKRNLGVGGVKRTGISTLLENPEHKRFAPSPKRAPWDRPSNRNRPSPDRVALSEDEEEFEQPDLMPTTTEDTEETAISIPATNKESNRQEVLSYLLQYETMIAQQEAEEVSTIQYILPLLDRLLFLGKEGHQFDEKTVDTSYPNTCDVRYNDLWKRSFTYRQLKLALEVLEAGGQDTLQSASCMGKDKQLMLILRVLTQKLAVSSAFEKSAEEVSITWAEIVHCYRVCVLGMLTLKQLPKQSAVRSRAKDRILAQLSLFEIPTTALLCETAEVNGDASDWVLQTENVELNKNTNLVRKNILAIAVVCIAALCVATGAGMIVKPSKTLHGDKSVALASRKVHEYVAVPFESANLTDIAVRSIKSTFSPARGNSASIIPPRKGHRDFQELAEAQILADALLRQSSDSASKDTTTIHDVKQPSSTNRVVQNWQWMPQGHQLVASALFGATVGVLGPSQIVVVIRFVAQSLSLGSLGVIPASLVVVGAVAVAVNIVRGLKFVLDHYFVFRKKRMA
jgi:hypothetical protein